MPNPGITKRVLAEAMKTHLSQRPLSKISVGDIVATCGLNRNSFYYHFKDKYDLVNWIFYTEYVAALGAEAFETSWDFVAHICRFFHANRAFYANALRETGQNSFYEYFSGLLRATLYAQVSTELGGDEGKAFYADFISDAFLAAITRWLRTGGKTPPDQFAGMMQQAITTMAVQVLKEAGGGARLHGPPGAEAPPAGDGG